MKTDFSTFKPAYPEAIEQFWFQQAMQETHTQTERDALRRFLPDIQRLTDRFTTEREVDAPMSAYLATARACIAYSLFFAPQTYARMAYLLRECPPSFPQEATEPVRMLDIGCGTGAASWAVLDHLSAMQPVHVDMLDQSRTALRFATQFFAQVKTARWTHTQLRTHVADITDPLPFKESYDVVLLHYALNELPSSAQRLLLSRAARLLKPNGLLFICEPLRHDAGDYMRVLREAAIKDFHLHIHAPCPHELPCPLPTACHDLRTWKLPRSLQMLNATLHRDLNHLAYAFLILSSAPSTSAASNGAQILDARVVGSPALQKGHAEFPACCSDGSMKQIQLLNREFDTAGRKWLRHLERGERLNLTTIQPLGDQLTHRAKIYSDTDPTGD